MLTIAQVLIWMFVVLAIKAAFILGFDVTIENVFSVAKDTKAVELILWLMFAIGMKNWIVVDAAYRNSFSKGSSVRMVEDGSGSMVEHVTGHFGSTPEYEPLMKSRKFTLIQIVVSIVGSVAVATV